MKILNLLLLLLIHSIVFSQNLNYSGYIYNQDGVGVSGIPVKIYKRTTSNLTGFTAQTNYNGHSYYRSTTTNTWTNSKTICESMNGHLATISDASENSFLFNTWPSGWIGYSQDVTSDYYSEPSGGWSWTESDVTRGKVADYDFSVNRSYSGSGTVVNNLSGTVHADLFRSQTNGYGYSTLLGDFMFFNTGGAANPQGYMATRNLATNFPVSSKDLTLNIWVLAWGNGVIVSERGAQSINSGWHDSNIEVTGSNGTTATLRLGLWNGSGISQISTTISVGSWNMVTLTYSGTTLKGYLNGIYFSQVAFSRQTPYANGNGLHYFLAGSDATNMGSGLFFDGRIGRFEVHNVALNDDEIKRVFMKSQARFGRTIYNNWNGGEPNNSGGENYAQFVGGGLWNDLPDYVSLNYVIEFDNIITTSSWILDETVYTDLTGKYTISKPSNPMTEYYFEISNLTIDKPSVLDFQSTSSVVLGSINPTSKSFYLFDVNNDGKISVSDSYYIYARINDRFTSWISPLPNYRIFTTSEWSTIQNSNTDLRNTIPGSQTVTIQSPVNNGTTNFYLIKTGKQN